MEQQRSAADVQQRALEDQLREREAGLEELRTQGDVRYACT